MSQPFRADHVGSLLRPPELLRVQADFAAQRISAADKRAAEDEAITTALNMQRQAGLEIFSDGEYRRGNWAGDFIAAVDGYVQGNMPVTFNWQLPEQLNSQTSEQQVANAMHAMPQQSGLVIGQKLRQKSRLTQEETAFLSQHAPGAWKITMPAASYVLARGWVPGTSDKAYESRRALGMDIAQIIRAEVAAVAGEGALYIQIDNPHYPDYLPDDRREQYRAMGLDPDQALEEDIAVDNASVQGLDRDKHILATHLCRGNGRSAWHTSGGYDRIAERLFGTLDVDRFLLEYDSDRSGGFEPLRYIPRGKSVVLGLVTTKSGQLESADLLRRRIDEAAKYVPLEQLMLSPQCGFASVSEGNLLTWDEQRRKLELVAETARKVWG
ncbi:MAG TPA: cobalamin-independent methionine synthase II family protein [Chloroflexota bacterium]|nr:cobalamin-independent methionine synthase II family protein [Chloroflexota bacterium]